MNPTRWLCAVVLLAASAALTGCDRGDTAGGGGATNPSAGGGGGGRLIGFSVQTMNNPFFVDLEKGMKSVVEGQKGDQLLTLDARYDSGRQRADIADLVNRGASLIFINPVNWEGVKGSLIEAKRANVPCIIVDAPVEDESLVISTVASDNVEAGRLAARALAAARPEAKLVILHLSVNKACIDRVAGFKEELAKHPKMTVLDTQEGKGTTEASRPVTLDLLGRYPELDAIFAINDPSALGAISALQSANRLEKVAVVSVDGSADAVKAIAQGKLLSTSAQFPVEMGQASAEQAYNHIEGRPVNKDVKVRVELIDKNNAAQFGGNAAEAAATAPAAQ
jgi:ribose transport system substrate-binding protein